MLGFAPLAAAPLGATDDSKVIYFASIDEAATASFVLGISGNFSAGVAETSSAASVINASGSVFGVGIFDGAEGQDSSFAGASVFVEIIEPSIAEADFGNEASLSVLIADGASGSDVPFVGTNYNSAVTDSSSVSDALGARATVSGLFSDAIFAATDTIFARAAFFVAATDASSALDSTSSRAAFAPVIFEQSISTDSTLVSSADISAIVSNFVQVDSALLAGSVYFVNMPDGAVIDDDAAAKLLWEVIPDPQSATWGTIQNAQTSTWGVIDDAQNTTWHVVQTQT